MGVPGSSHAPGVRVHRRPLLSTVAAAAAVVATLLGGLAATPAPAQATTAAGPAYVSLGDSYTSSPLTGPSAGPPPGCLRSTNNYPHLVAARIGAALTDVSCSGATTADFSSPQAVDGGTNPPQYAALSRSTRLVTVGIGGNDIGFSEIVRNCISPTPTGTPCRDRYTAGGTDQLRARITALGPTLARVLAEVHRRAPQARVLIVGYPSVLPATGPGCYPAVPYTPGDVDYLRGVLGALDAQIATRARQGRATYVDTYTPTIGHDVCQVPGVKWIEGLTPTAPAYPVHPNALGAAALSRAVLATLGAS